jgi:hypothetical protein
MLTVQAEDPAKSSKARSIMENNGAVRLEEFKEQWDPEVWSVFDEQHSPQVQRTP